jgi:hypothetical protein
MGEKNESLFIGGSAKDQGSYFFNRQKPATLRSWQISAHLFTLLQ